MLAQMEPELAQQLAGDPSRQLDVIVMVGDDLDGVLSALPSDVEVRHRYRLLRSIALSAPAGALLRVAEMETVTSIQIDHSVQAYEDDS